MSGIHQFVPMLHVGDATGRHTLALHQLLRARGVDSEIFVERGDPQTADLTRPAHSYGMLAQGGDVLVYQFATESALVPWLATRTERLVVNYHNVTPAEYFAPWDNPLARAQLRARQQVAVLAPRTAVAVAVSEYNRRELVEAGYRTTRVIPPIVDLGGMSGEQAIEDDVDRVGATGGRGATNWLAVGRLAPNKAVEDIIEALFLYRRRYDRSAELVLVGKPAVVSYERALREHVAELGLLDAVRFAGHVGDDELSVAYRCARGLVVASEHEGFCLPVVEAMAHGVPIVAYRQGAVPEVLGECGLVIDDKDPATLAEAMHRIDSDGRLRAGTREAGRRRLAGLNLEAAGPDLVDLLLAVRDGRRREVTAALG